MVPVIADVAANLEAAAGLMDAAATAGAEWIILPEFFTSGAGFRDDLAEVALAPDGAATRLLQEKAVQHGATVGGSFLCRDGDGEVRNAFLLVGPDGSVLGRHDKDLPTMWENALYVGGTDDGVIAAGEVSVGAAVCWEYMRSQTARRLRGRVDLVVGGSFWWSVPELPPRRLMRAMEASNRRTFEAVVPHFARLVGAPVVHASNDGPLTCRTPWMPMTYHGFLKGGAVIVDARGQVLARREVGEGAGFAIAEVRPGRAEPTEEIPSAFWLHARDPISRYAWHYQRLHGRRWYRRRVAGRPALELDRPPV